VNVTHAECVKGLLRGYHFHVQARTRSGGVSEETHLVRGLTKRGAWLRLVRRTKHPDIVICVIGPLD
jgi:hypothetical protein